MRKHVPNSNLLSTTLYAVTAVALVYMYLRVPYGFTRRALPLAVGTVGQLACGH